MAAEDELKDIKQILASIRDQNKLERTCFAPGGRYGMPFTRPDGFITDSSRSRAMILPWLMSLTDFSITQTSIFS